MSKEPVFEEAIKELEEIVQNLEDGNLNLDQSIKMFQRGMELSGICSKQIDQAEQKINMLVQLKGGNFEEVPYPQEEE